MTLAPTPRSASTATLGATYAAAVWFAVMLGWCDLYFGDDRASSPDAEAPADASEDLGLIGWWPGDGDLLDHAGASDGVAAGLVGYVDGPRGYAFLFDGNGSIAIPADGFPAGTADRTLALWARVDEVVAQESFFAGYGAFGTSDAVFALGATVATSPTPEPFFSQWGSAILGPPSDLGTWHHIAAAHRAGISTLYVDGVVAGSGAFNLSTDSGPLYVGRPPAAAATLRRLVGAVDDIRLYDRALSGPEVAALAVRQ